MNPDSVAGESNDMDDSELEHKLIFNPSQFKKSLFERFDNGAPRQKLGPMSPGDFTSFKGQLPIKNKTRITQPERLSTMEDFCGH